MPGWNSNDQISNNYQIINFQTFIIIEKRTIFALLSICKNYLLAKSSRLTVNFAFQKVDKVQANRIQITHIQSSNLSLQTENYAKLTTWIIKASAILVGKDSFTFHRPTIYYTQTSSPMIIIWPTHIYYRDDTLFKVNFSTATRKTWIN